MTISQTVFYQAVDAIITGDEDTLKQLLTDNPHLTNMRSSVAHNATLLHYVGANGVEDDKQQTPHNILIITEILLEHGADPNVVASLHGTPTTPLGAVVTSFYPAQAGKQVDLVHLLCKNGANPDGVDGDDPLSAALYHGFTSAANALVENGTRLTNLVTVSAFGSANQLKTILSQPIDIQNPHLPQTEPAIKDLALISATRFAKIENVKHLLSAGFNVHARAVFTNATPLHIACAIGDAELVQLLIENGADTTLQDAEGNTPRQLAQSRNHTAILDLFA
ncbi:MAG: ankyrin repeat domain-containing protein [Chloroflexota bacterium]